VGDPRANVAPTAGAVAGDPLGAPASSAPSSPATSVLPGASSGLWRRIVAIFTPAPRGSHA
jgi:hypothetical protein